MTLKNKKIYTLAVSFFLANILFIATCISHAENSATFAPSRDGDLLIQAIEKNDEAKVNELLMMKINPNSRGFKNQYMSPLSLAATQNNKNIAENLIKYGADVKEKGIVSRSLGSVEILNLLITHGADINDTHVSWSSPMHNAISLELLNSADLLLKHGANINDQNNMSKHTPLQNAAQYGKELSVKWLLDNGADVNLKDAMGQTAITIGASYKANTKILKMLVDHGASLSPQEIQKITQGACRAGNLDALEFLTSKGVSFDFDACYTALAYVPSPSQDVLKWLTSRSKIKNIQVGKESMLHIAVENNSLEIAKLLIASGADVNLKGVNGRPPLDGAISHISDTTNKANYKEMVTLLASHGADFNIKYGQQQTTALHELVKGISCVDTRKEFQARCNNLTEAVELLIASGADVNAFDINSNTPLHFAAITNNIVLIKVLVAHGADLKFTNSRGLTPLMSSMTRGSWDQTINRELTTIGTLVSLENKTGIAPDWEGLKGVANKVRDPREKQQILTLLDQLEKNPSATSQGNNLGKAITKIIDDSPKTLKEKLASCDSRVALAAASELIKNPDTLKEPLELFSPAFALFLNGKKDDAVFWFYAAQLRVQYQLIFEKGDRGQLLSVMMMTMGSAINNYAFQDTSKLNQTLDSVLKWDKSTPNPFHDKPRTKDDDNQITKIYSSFRDLKAKLVNEKDDLEKTARLAAPQIQAMSNRSCQSLPQ